MEEKELEKKETKEKVEATKEKVVSDDELVEDVDYSKDDAPVQVIYRCKKCGQILGPNAKDCWKCSSKEIEEVVEEDTKEIRKVLLSARIDKLDHDVKELKKSNNLLFFLLVVLVVVICVYFFTR